MRLLSLETLASSFSPGERVFLPGSAGESPVFTKALAEDPKNTKGLFILTSFVPGINPLPIHLMSDDVRISALFMHPGTEPAQQDGRLQHLPTSYAGFTRALREHLTFDATVLHVSPPTASGRYSLGVAAEFSILAAARSKRVIGVINPQMPLLERSPSLAASDFTAIGESDSPLRTYDPGNPDNTAMTISRTIATFIPDGATLQLGLGKVPSALTAVLSSHRRLRLWSGMLSDGLMQLAHEGALDPTSAQVCCAAIGSAAFYRSLAMLGALQVSGCDITHDAGRLAALPFLVAVNSALEVDLYGQCNLEQANGRFVSGAGGAPDFAAAAARGNGLSIVALPATAGRQAKSRIVPRLPGGLVTLPRHDVNMVVTEYGAADLRGLSASRRADALIAVAAPEAQENLARTWRDGTPLLGIS